MLLTKSNILQGLGWGVVSCCNSEFEEGDEENGGEIDDSGGGPSRGGPTPGVEASGSGTGGCDRCRIIALMNCDGWVSTDHHFSVRK